MEYIAEGRIRYRISFEDAPQFDSADFSSVRIYAVGDRIDVPDEARNMVEWTVREIVTAAEGEPDTLEMTRQS